jgi:mono/diheme cytochrome c family protein
VGAALLLAGCGGGGEAVTDQSGADLAKGKTLFSKTCGGCHVLADAATAGTVGPNLDQAFGFSCKQGFDHSTFFDVVRSQIDIPARDGQMPADLVTGQDAVDVAAYVASAAGKDVRGCGEEAGGGGATGATTTGGGATGATTSGRLNAPG